MGQQGAEGGNIQRGIGKAGVEIGDPLLQGRSRLFRFLLASS